MATHDDAPRPEKPRRGLSPAPPPAGPWAAAPGSRTTTICSSPAPRASARASSLSRWFPSTALTPLADNPIGRTRPAASIVDHGLAQPRRGRARVWGQGARVAPRRRSSRGADAQSGHPQAFIPLRVGEESACMNPRRGRSHWDDGPSAALADREKLFRVLRALDVEGAIPTLTTVWTARHLRPAHSRDLSNRPRRSVISLIMTAAWPPPRPRLAAAGSMRKGASDGNTRRCAAA